MIRVCARKRFDQTHSVLFGLGLHMLMASNELQRTFGAKLGAVNVRRLGDAVRQQRIVSPWSSGTTSLNPSRPKKCILGVPSLLEPSEAYPQVNEVVLVM